MRRSPSGPPSALRPSDFLAPLHRDLGAHLWRGMEPGQVMASFMGKATSPTGGRDGTLHYGRLDLNIYNPPSHIPDNYPVATGAAFAFKYAVRTAWRWRTAATGRPPRATSTRPSTSPRCMQLPCIFIVENNQYSYSTPLTPHHRVGRLRARPRRTGCPGHAVDGIDVLAVHDATAEAVARARAGEGPSLIEAVTMRMHGHAEHDPADYVPRGHARGVGETRPGGGVRRHAWSSSDVSRRGGVQASPGGGAPGNALEPGAGARHDRCPTRATGRRAYMQTETTAQTVHLPRCDHRRPWRARWTADPDVFLIGEDVGQFGGAFKVTKGFLDKFGPRRVVDTPIAESGFTGLAAARRCMGLRPVVEYQFADFISCAFDQIINVMRPAPLPDGQPDAGDAPGAVRRPAPRRAHAFAEHRIVLRSRSRPEDRRRRATPEDAAGLLISSIRDNNPVLYLESKYLYRRLEAPGPLSLEPMPLGSGQGGPRRQPGQRASPTRSAYAPECLEAAAELDKEGISVEVVDVRTLVPLDVETIVGVGAQDLPGRGRCTRTPAGSATAPRSPPSSRRSASGGWTGPWSGSGRRTPPRRQVRRLRTRSCPRRRKSPKSCGGWQRNDRP